MKRCFAASTKPQKGFGVPSMERYYNLFNQSNIIEKMIPRELTSHQQMQAAYPNVLKDDEQYELSDFNAINTVSFTFPSLILYYEFRQLTNPSSTLWIEVASGGDQCSA